MDLRQRFGSASSSHFIKTIHDSTLSGSKLDATGLTAFQATNDRLCTLDLTKIIPSKCFILNEK